MQNALNRVSMPRAASGESRYFFWSGLGSRQEHIKNGDPGAESGIKASGVRDAHAHRFRHTLATEVLTAGGSMEDAANILGDSPQIIRKH